MLWQCLQCANLLNNMKLLLLVISANSRELFPLLGICSASSLEATYVQSVKTQKCNRRYWLILFMADTWDLQVLIWQPDISDLHYLLSYVLYREITSTINGDGLVVPRSKGFGVNSQELHLSQRVAQYWQQQLIKIWSIRISGEGESSKKGQTCEWKGKAV